MKTRYKHIHFVENNDQRFRYVCRNNKSNDILGFISFYSAWGQFIFEPATVHYVFSHDCLTDIADFLSQLK